METRAHYIAVGLFLVLGGIAVIGFAIWLGRLDFGDDDRRYQIFFKGSVTGLREGSSVQYHGVPAGRVLKLSIDRDDPENVKVLVAVLKKLHLKKSVYATIEMSGLAGSKFIQIYGGLKGESDLVARAGKKYPIISSKPSAIDDVLSSVPRLVNKVLALVDSFQTLVSDENLKRVKNIVKNVDGIVATVAKRDKELDTMIAEGSKAVQNLRIALEDARRMIKTIDKGAKAFTEGGVKAFEQVQVSLKSLETILDENRAAIYQFTSGGLQDFSGLVADLKESFSGLNRVVGRLESDPLRFIAGDQTRGVKPE